jgi:anti-anti-sigma regulatory factor
MAGHPLSGLCGYRLGLGHDTVKELASLHALASPRTAGLTVFGCPDGAIGLRGQYDPASLPALRRLLGRIGARGEDGVVVDLAGVRYVDHRLLRMLDDHAREHGVSVSVRSAPPFTARLMELLAASGGLQAQEGGNT